MSTIRQTTYNASTASSTTSTSRTSRKHTTHVTATRANSDPPALDFPTINRSLSLTETQRDHVRPAISSDQRKQAQIVQTRWYSVTARRTALWHARDQTINHLQRTLDSNQMETLHPQLGPTT
ncbi:MAG TPA: hypothetical protein VFE58_16540 [Tepidisphaeraceae bacterium]|jgi:hypothetical protein|nr:hypothetical protein [Tepidisphaeraceae bacterium]